MGYVLEFLSALLTPIIAIIATYIAWQQWKTNKQRLNLERYERRLRVYEEVKKILSIMIRDADVTTGDLAKFRTSVSEADFLFEPEISEYLDEVQNHGLLLWRWNREYRDSLQERPPDYDHEKVVAEMHKELQWLMKQFHPAKEKFHKYLNISR